MSKITQEDRDFRTKDLKEMCQKRDLPNYKEIDRVVFGVWHNDLVGNYEAEELIQQMKNEATNLDKYMHDCQLLLEKFGISVSMSYPNGQIKEITKKETFLGWEGVFAGETALDPEIYDTQLYGPVAETKWLLDKYEIGLVKGDTTSGGGGDKYSYCSGCYIELEQFPLMFEAHKFKKPLLKHKDDKIKLQMELDTLTNEFKKDQQKHYSRMLNEDSRYNKLVSAKYNMERMIKQCQEQIDAIEKDTSRASAREASFHIDVPVGLDDHRINSLKREMFPTKYSKTKGDKITALFNDIQIFEDDNPELFLS